MTEYRVRLHGKTIGFVIFQDNLPTIEAKKKLVEEGYDPHIHVKFLRVL